MRMSLPDSSRCVANEWRNVWHVARVGMPEARTARRIACCTTVSCRWWRRRWPVSGWTYGRVAGNTHCHAQSRPAFGSFRASACGSSTQPAPPATSRWCYARRSDCARSRRPSRAAGSTRAAAGPSRRAASSFRPSARAPHASWPARAPRRAAPGALPARSHPARAARGGHTSDTARSRATPGAARAGAPATPRPRRPRAAARASGTT